MNSSFKVGSLVKVKHSNTQYDGRYGTVTGTIGTNYCWVDLPARQRKVNGPTGHPGWKTDKPEIRQFKTSSLQAGK
ncbi:hypothetical protein [Hymenobacter sp. B81]|uniref:hypothetical protein n=1 Tax=Hymenobacter sp. B81 TaxID=3344878 RepID=UPI0037DD5E10